LKLDWPVWAKKNGDFIQCESDEDCKFPQTCCPDPIVPGNHSREKSFEAFTL
jgi:hypothetical protein